MSQDANTAEISIGDKTFSFAVNNSNYNRFLSESARDIVRAATNLLVSSAVGQAQKEQLKTMTQENGMGAVFVEVAALLAEDFTPTIEVALKKSTKPLIA